MISACKMAAEGRASSVVKSGFRVAAAAFFEYDTPKIVHIKSKKVGIINRLIQLCIFAYIIGYAIIYKKGYQEFDEVESVALTKLKGVLETDIPGYNRTWDVADYVVPPEEVDAFFITTNLVWTRRQKQGVCQEDPGIPDAVCTNNTGHCVPGRPVINGNGVMTGDCEDSTRKNDTKVCLIRAWCEVEKDEDPIPGQALLNGTENFTVLIKNWIVFPKFGQKRRNILDSIDNQTYLQSCRYNASDDTDQFCPIFTIGTIISEAGEDMSIAIKGGVIAISIEWDCNLDFDISYCKPKYSFRRLDEKDVKISKGWNFRYANYYYENGVEMRDLLKATGIRFVIKVTGTAGKFNPVPLLTNIGSGIGLLAIATVLCDIVVLYILKKGDFYQKKKYLYVTGDDAFKNKLLSSGEYGSVDERQALMASQMESPLSSLVKKTTDRDGLTNEPRSECELTYPECSKQEEEPEGARNRRKPGEYERLDD